MLNTRYLNWKLRNLDRIASTKYAPSASAVEPHGAKEVDRVSRLRNIEKVFDMQHVPCHRVAQDLAAHLGEDCENSDHYEQHVRQAMDELFYQPDVETGIRKVHLSSVSPASPPQEKRLDNISNTMSFENDRVPPPVWSSPLHHSTLHPLPSEQFATTKATMSVGLENYEASTRDQWMRLQEARLRRVLLSKREWWLRQQQLPDANKAASTLAKFNLRWKQHNATLKRAGLLIHTLPTAELSEVFEPLTLQRFEEAQNKLRLADHLKHQLRCKKIQMAKEFKRNQASTHVQQSVFYADPYQQHQQLRAVRLAALIKAYLEPMLTHGTADFRYGVMKGIQVSVTGVFRKTPTSLVNVYYTVLSNHSPALAQERLDLATPYLRYRLQTKLDFPRAPQLKFIYATTEPPPHRYNRALLAQALRSTRPLQKPPPDAVHDFIHAVKH